MAEVPRRRSTRQRPGLDPESEEWIGSLTVGGPEREKAVERLRALLLRVAQSEIRRRAGSLAGPELDDLANQAANDASLAVLAKLHEFRGDSRFTTWAFRFVIFDVSRKLSRHFWRGPAIRLEDEDWDRLPDRFGLDPERRVEWHDLVAALRRAIDAELTAHQRRIFVALVLHDVPVDVLAAELGTNRGAIYKAMFDARRKLRRSLVANGYVDVETERDS